jgi:O-antigen/teichoic acid export membrane protein
MGEIRRQSIFSSLLIYVGFVFGAVNTYLFTKQGLFNPSEYGLTQAMVSINQVFFAFSCLGMVSVISRFFPYYNDHLNNSENDLLALAFTVSLAGFVMVVAGGIVFQSFFIRKFSEKSPQLVYYYYWLFPFTFFYLAFSILEAHAAIHKKTVFPSFLREGMVRICTTVLILLYLFRLISFDLFVKLFSCIYAVTAFVLFVYLKRMGKLRLVFKISSVTKEKGREISRFVAYVFAGVVIFNLAQQIDSISIGSQQGLEQLGIYTLAQYMATVVQVPQRGIAAIATPYMAQAWKDQNHGEINRIYARSSINLLILGLFIFFNIWLNIDDIYSVLHLDKAFEAGKYVVLILAITKIIDLGTGMNSQLLYTSPSWRFEFFSGIVLLFLALPLNYFLVKHIGIMGAAWANLIAIGIYNAIRLIFIYRKYGMQPFTLKTIRAILVAVAIYFILYVLMGKWTGWAAILTRSFCYSAVFIVLVYFLQLTPDLKAVLDSVRQRFKRS